MAASDYFKNKILPCLYDSIFKELFGNEDDPEIVASLMSILLNIPFSLVQDKIIFLQKGLKNAQYLDKNGEKDVVFKIFLESPLKILLEVNLIDNKDNTKITRNFYWQANIYGTNLKKGESHENIIPTVQYNFNLFPMNPNKRKIIYHYKALEVSDFDELFENKTFEIYYFNIEEMKDI